MIRSFAVAALALMTALPAQAFVADNDLVVEPQANGIILVPWRGSSAATDFWCAAADYAKRRLGAKVTDRLYRVSPPPRPQGEGISFSLTPPATPLPVSFLASETGEMSISMATSFCEPIVWPRLDD